MKQTLKSSKNLTREDKIEMLHPIVLKPFKELVGKPPLKALAWFSYCEVNEESGEVEKNVLVVKGEDGYVYGTVSTSFFREWNAFLDDLDGGDIREFEVIEKVTRNNRKCLLPHVTAFEMGGEGNE